MLSYFDEVLKGSLCDSIYRCGTCDGCPFHEFMVSIREIMSPEEELLESLREKY